MYFYLILSAAGAWVAYCCWLMVSSNVAVELVGTRWRVGVVLYDTRDPMYKDVVDQ